MDDTALRAALKKLLAHGEAAEDSKLMKLAASKKGPPAAAPCPDCALLEDGEKCEKCAALEGEESGGEDELAGLLEQGTGEA